MKLLIIEDDPKLAETIEESITHLFDCAHAPDGEEGLFLAQQNIFDVIILDIMLPKMNGYDVLKEMRRNRVLTPVIFLTAKDGIDDKILGFKVGADDYLVKPFHREELILRLEAIIRRSVGLFEQHMVTFKDLKLNVQQKAAMIEGNPLSLNGKQYELLEYLVNNQHSILTKEQIFDRIWGFESDTSSTVVEVYASHLRKKLKPFHYDKYIRTFRGLGYMLTDQGINNE